MRGPDPGRRAARLRLCLLLGLAWLFVPFATPVSAADPLPLTARVAYRDGRPGEEMRVLVSGSEVWLSAQDITAIFAGRRSWRADIRRMVLTFGEHEVALVVGSETAFLDRDDPVHLPGPIPYREGRVYIPFSLFLALDGSLRSWVPETISWNPDELVLTVGAERSGGLLSVRVESGREERLDLVVDEPYEYRLVSAARSRFVLRLPGAVCDPDSLVLPAGGERFLALAVSRIANGTAVSFAVPEDVLGYQILRLERPNRISVVLSSDERAIREGRLTPFAGSGLDANASIRTIVIDPGHGGDDPGTSSARGVKESDFVLSLARDVALKLGEQLGVNAILTRDSDRALTIEQRIDAANVAGADLFLSLHLDGYPSPRVRGPRAVVARPPAGAPRAASGSLKDLGFRAWGDAQRGSVNRAYLFADRLVGEVAAALDIPSRGVEEWPLPLLNGVMMPAVFLELDAMTADGADDWIGDPAMRSRAVDAVVTAIDRYRREAP